MRPSVPDLQHAVGVVRGTNGGIAAASTVNVSDTADPDSDVEAHALVFTGTSVSEGEDGQALIDITTGIKSLLNNSGADVDIGTVVVTDSTANDAFTTTTTAEFTAGAVGVTQAAIPSGTIGPVLFSGYASIVNVTAAVTRGTFLETSTTAGKATTNASRRKGSFGVVLTGADPASNVTTGATVLGSQLSTLQTAGTSMTITVPTIDDGFGGTSVPGDGLVMVLMLQRSVSTTPTITGWTRVGATAGFFYYYRVTSSEPASYTATWTTSGQAVALVVVVDGLDTASLVAGSAFDSTTAAAAITGLASAYYWAIAGVDAQVATPSGWTALLGGTTSSGTGTPAAIVQGANAAIDIGKLTITLPSAVTPGNLLVLVTSRRDGAAGLAYNIPGHTDWTRDFTAFGSQVVDTAAKDQLVIGYRVATGDEQTIENYSGNYQRARLYEISNAGDPTGFEVRSATLQSSSSSKSLGAFGTAGTIQVAGFIMYGGTVGQTAGAGWTEDYEAVASSHPDFWAGSCSTGTTPQISGTSYPWAGMAVGITTASVSVAAELVGQTFSGTGVTSPFTGASAQNDGLIAFNLKTQDVFVTTQTADAIIFGWPDRKTDGGLASDMTTITPTQLAANTDNWNPTGLSTATVIRASTDASRNLTGIVAPATSWALLLENVGAFDLVLKHDVTSTAANRFYCPNDTDLTLQKDTSVLLGYDTTSSRWRVIGGTGGASGAITSSGLTMSTARLLGRTTASTGAIEEITVGTGLSLSAGSLIATGTGGAIEVAEVDGNPDDAATTKLVFPNGTLSIVAHVATYTPASGGLSHGSAFPGSPATNDYYGRDDLLGTIFQYNGTRWLCTCPHEWILGYPHDAAFGTSGLTATTSIQRGNVPMLQGGSDIWLVGWQLGFLVASGGTALGASHKWVATTSYVIDANTTTDAGPTINIDSGSSAVYRQLTGTIGALLNNGTQHDTFLVTWTKTGTPGNLRVVGGPTISYRIVAT